MVVGSKLEPIAVEVQVCTVTDMDCLSWIHGSPL